MTRTLWEEVHLAGREYLARLEESTSTSIESSGQDYITMLSNLIETQVELAEVIGASRPMPPMTWETVTAALDGQKQVVAILEDARKKAIISIDAHDVSAALSSLDSLVAAWRSIAPWDYDRTLSKVEVTIERPSAQI